MHSFPGVNNKGSTVWTTKRHYGKDGCKCIWKMWLQSRTALKGKLTGWKISMFNRNTLTQMMDFPCSSRILLVVSTHLKHITQNGNLPQIGMNINIPPDVFPRVCFHYFSSTPLEWVHLFLWYLQCFSCSMYCFGVWNVVIYSGNQI